MNSSNNLNDDDNTDTISSYNSISHQVIIVLTLTAADFIILCRLNTLYIQLRKESLKSDGQQI